MSARHRTDSRSPLAGRLAVLPKVARTTVVAAALLATGCTGGTQEQTENVVETAQIDEIRIEGGSGSVHVTPGSEDVVEMEVTTRSLGDGPGSQHSVDGSALVLRTGCGQSCSVDYRVTAPAGVSVTGTNGSGDVEVNGVRTVDVATGSGRVAVESVEEDVSVATRSGAVELRDLGGAIAVESGSGRLSGSDLRGGITVEGASGDVELTMSEPGDVSVVTRSGNVELTVPDAAYAIETGSTSGRVEVAMRSDPGGAHSLQVRTGSGDIAVRL